jgi:hypothetical protein
MGVVHYWGHLRERDPLSPLRTGGLGRDEIAQNPRGSPGAIRMERVVVFDKWNHRALRVVNHPRICTRPCLVWAHEN